MQTAMLWLVVKVAVALPPVAANTVNQVIKDVYNNYLKLWLAGLGAIGIACGAIIMMFGGVGGNSSAVASGIYHVAKVVLAVVVGLMAVTIIGIAVALAG